MISHAKGTAMVLGPEEGESFWQPLPSTGYVINKINPYNSPYDTFSTGLQVLESGAHVRRGATNCYFVIAAPARPILKASFMTFSRKA